MDHQMRSEGKNYYEMMEKTYIRILCKFDRIRLPSTQEKLLLGRAAKKTFILMLIKK